MDTTDLNAGTVNGTQKNADGGEVVDKNMVSDKGMDSYKEIRIVENGNVMASKKAEELKEKSCYKNKLSRNGNFRGRSCDTD